MAAALGDGRLTFGEVQERADAVRHALRDSWELGDRVVVWSRTDLRLVPLFAAAAQAGAVFVPISPRLTDGEAGDVVRTARPRLLLADDERIDAAQSMAEERAVEVIPIEGLECDRASERSPQPALPPPELRETDPHVVFFTSGTSGRPKGVVLSHRVDVLRTHPGAQFEPRGIAVCSFPLFHMAGWTIALQQWHARDGVVFVGAASAEEICRVVREHRATRLNCVPAVWRRVLDHAEVELSSLRFADTGTSATPPDLLDAIAAVAPQALVRVFYGSSEAGNVTTLEHHDLRRKPGSVGVPSVSTEIRIADDGELWVRGPLLADGYFDDATATGKAFVDGWYRTGDLGEVDHDGYLSIVGRLGEAIRTGGEAVAPSEVEVALLDHPSVDDVAVFGHDDADWGEIVAAAIVVRAADELPSPADLSEFLAPRLARHKHPRVVVALDAIPRTSATGQIQRSLLGPQVRAALEREPSRARP
jgi:acyl-CoA synthetase (AMP-forming)/AMP-acid ligase II